MLRWQSGTLSLTKSGHPAPSHPSNHHLKLIFFSSPTDFACGGGGREGERERTSGLSQAWEGLFFFPLILFYVMGHLLRRRKSTEKNTLLLLLLLYYHLLSGPHSYSQECYLAVQSVEYSNWKCVSRHDGPDQLCPQDATWSQHCTHQCLLAVQTGICTKCPLLQGTLLTGTGRIGCKILSALNWIAVFQRIMLLCAFKTHTHTHTTHTHTHNDRIAHYFSVLQNALYLSLMFSLHSWYLTSQVLALKNPFFLGAL